MKIWNFVKLRLHSSCKAQNSIHFDEIFEHDFQIDLGSLSSTFGTRRLPRKSTFATTATSASHANARSSTSSATSASANATTSTTTAGSTASLAKGFYGDGDQVARQFRFCRWGRLFSDLRCQGTNSTSQCTYDFSLFSAFFCHLEKRFESRFRSPSWTTKRKNFFVLKYNLQDRVLVEAAFNANMPFKWNATRIQVLPNQNSNKPMNPNSSTSVTSTSTLNAHAFANPSNAPQIQTHQPPPPVQQRMNHNRNEAAFGSGNGASNSRGNEHGGGRNNESRMRQPSPPVRDLKRMSSNNDHRNRRDDRSNTRDRSDGGRDNRDRSRDKDRSNSRASPPTLSRKRSRSPRRTRSRSRSRSPPRRRVRIAPRYNVSVPKVSLNFPDR